MSLPFPGSRGHLHSMARGPFRQLTTKPAVELRGLSLRPPAPSSCLPLALILLPPSHKDSWGDMGPSWIIPDNLPHPTILNESHPRNPLCHVRLAGSLVPRIRKRTSSEGRRSVHSRDFESRTQQWVLSLRILCHKQNHGTCFALC